MLCLRAKTFNAKRSFRRVPGSGIFAFNKNSRPIIRIHQLPGVRSFICVPTYRVFELTCRATGTQEHVRILIEDASYVTAEVRQRKILHMALQRLFS